MTHKVRLPADLRQIVAELAREAMASSVKPGDDGEQARLWLRHWVGEANRAVHEARQAASSRDGDDPCRCAGDGRHGNDRECRR